MKPEQNFKFDPYDNTLSERTRSRLEVDKSSGGCNRAVTEVSDDDQNYEMVAEYSGC